MDGPMMKCFGYCVLKRMDYLNEYDKIRYDKLEEMSIKNEIKMNKIKKCKVKNDKVVDKCEYANKFMHCVLNSYDL